jgi:NADP-dependent 3-hydroxy acid dehydrogenase YdfG
MMNLQDRVVVVTGAGSGIGRATALLFAKQGARLAVCDLDQSRLDALATELGDRQLVSRRVDVADRAQMSAFAGAVHALAPAADVVVNNAGVAIGGNFLDTTLDDFDWIIGINLRGVVHGCHFFVPNMVEAKRGGQIINVSSILGIYGGPSSSAYSATKFAVRGFSESLRQELARNKIGVTAICPGLIDTRIIEDGRLTSAKLAERKDKMLATWKKGLPASKVADVILAAVHSNPAVKTVGVDALVISTLNRFAPRALRKMGGTLRTRLGV